MWLALSNKILTWNDGQERNWQGPGRCIMCKSNEGTVNCLFVQYVVAREVWNEDLKLSNGNNGWEKETLLDCFENWYKDKTMAAHKPLPCFFM